MSLFQTQEFKPVSLLQNEDLEYMLALKQEFVASMRKSPYYIKESEKRADIERYSDKYQLSQQEGSAKFEPGMYFMCLLDVSSAVSHVSKYNNSKQLISDWRRLPEELKIKEKKKRKTKSSAVPNIPRKQNKSADKSNDAAGTEEIIKTLEV